MRMRMRLRLAECRLNDARHEVEPQHRASAGICICQGVDWSIGRPNSNSKTADSTRTRIERGPSLECHSVQLARYHLLLQLSRLSIPSKSRPPTLSRRQVDEVLFIHSTSSPLTARKVSASYSGQSSSVAMLLAPLPVVSLPFAFSLESVKVLSPPDS